MYAACVGYLAFVVMGRPRPGQSRQAATTRALVIGAVVFLLHKLMPPRFAWKFFFGFKVVPGKRTTFRAVRGVSLAIEEDSLLVLLGHNGAGKTTTFNMLTGLMPSNGGDATIFGMSIRTDLAKIQR